MSYDTFIHLFAGGLGGTFGAIITCPLEVVKTRLQSSVATFDNAPKVDKNLPNCKPIRNKQLTIWNCIRHIINTEGPRALFKGLGPNIVGVAPSRALYFCAYSQTKTWCNQKIQPDTPLVHMISAGCAGFVSCTLTNPIWFIKTRMQLDQSLQGISTWNCIKNVYRTSGIMGFYKGISASYFGISETIIHFVIYESIKVKLFDYKPDPIIPIGVTPPILPQEETKGKQLSFIQYSASAAMSKTFASIVAYPHEVVRTRLREEGDKYRRFWQTIVLVYKEEGIRHGLYRGLATQLIRQIPNTAIMMGTYEVVVYFMKNLPLSLRNNSSQHNKNW